MTYFAIARKPGKRAKYGLLLVTKKPGEMSRQEWTGQEFQTWEAAEAAMVAKNEELFWKRVQ